MMNVIKNFKLWFGISGLVLILGIASLAVFGLKTGIDFKGGTSDQLEFTQAPDQVKIRDILAAQNIGATVVQQTDNNGIIIKTPPIEKEQHDKILSEIKSQVGDFTEKSYSSIGPIIGKELRTKAIYQFILVCAGIIFYLAYAFRKVSKPVTSWQFGWAAIIALLHDLLVVVGIFSVLGHFFGIEVDSLFVTALLTVLGFSVHDTIVVFDRIRENLRVDAGKSIEDVVNHSINQTIVRSLNTSLTVLFVLLSLVLFGGETIKIFALALFVGVFVGTYSSIFVASPTLVLWQRWRAKRA